MAEIRFVVVGSESDHPQQAQTVRNGKPAPLSGVSSGIQTESATAAGAIGNTW